MACILYLLQCVIQRAVTCDNCPLLVYNIGVITGAMASQITSLTNVYSTVYSGADQREYQSSAPLAFVRGIHRGPVNSPHKWQVSLRLFPFDDVIISAKPLDNWTIMYDNNTSLSTNFHISLALSGPYFSMQVCHSTITTYRISNESHFLMRCSSLR